MPAKLFYNKKMNNTSKEIILNKVVLKVSRVPREVKMVVYRATGIEKKNTYVISSMDTDTCGVMAELNNPILITKTNILNVNPCFSLGRISATTWCLEDQLPSAKELCNAAMELYLLQNIRRANTMNEIFSSYKTKLK